MSISSNRLLLIFILLVLGIILSFVMSPLFLVSTIIISLAMVVYSKNLQENFAIFFFLFSYFFFLMSSEFVQEVFGVINTRVVTEEARYHTQVTLLLGIIAIIIGYCVKFSKHNNKEYAKYDNRNIEQCESIRYVTRIILYSSFVFYIIPLLEQAIYVYINSYFDYYISFESKLPLIIEHIGDIWPIAFCIFLSTFPDKKECKPLLFLYFIHGSISLLTGKRFYFIAMIIFLVSYALIRNFTDREKGTIWISKRVMTFGLSALPLICILLYSYSFIRSGKEVDSSMSYIDRFFQFFNVIGESDKVIKYGYMYKDRIPAGHMYSFGGLIDYFRYNSFTKLFTGETLVRSQNVEYAINGNGFGHMITYLVLPNRFLAGYGLGSCFLAELFQDGGYIGIVFGSFFYGVFIRNLITIDRNRIIKTAIALYMYTALIRAPRASYDVFLQEIINVKFIVFFIFIFALSNLVKKNMIKKNRRNCIGV